MKQYPANPIQAAACHRYLASPGGQGAQTQVSISFGESVNADFLRHAWQVVIQRHPILRSAFSKTLDGVTIREADKAETHWISLDWQNIPREEIPEKWNALMDSDAKATFEPVSLPLVRFHEIKLPGGGGHYLLTSPEFLLDEFSLTRVLLDLLLTLGQSPLAMPGESPAAAKPKGWKEFLEGAQAPMRLQPRPGEGPFVRSSILLDRTKTAEFSKFCHDNDLEECLVIRCLWSLVLRRFGATGNLMLCRFDGRGEFTEAGYCHNWLPVVQSWSGSVGDWLDAAQLLEDTIAENIWVDPAEVLRAVGLDVSPDDIPVSFVWRGTSINDIIHTALPRWINFDAQIQPVAFRGLRLVACPGPRLELLLGGALPSEAAVKELLSRLAMLLSGLAESQKKPVERLPVLLREEIQTQREWSHGPNLPVESPSVVDAFKKTATRHAGSVAVRFGGQETTYAELDALSDRLAAHLEAAGVDGGWHVALVMSPSSWIGVALLGVWKAGNSCLALDPTAPPEWIESTLSAHDAAIVICDSATAERIDPGQRRRIVIDTDFEATGDDKPKPREVTSEALAASIPGHVDSAPPLVRALTHGMLLTAAVEGARLLGFGAGDSFLVRSMPGGGSFFDEWVLPLLAGGTAHVAGEDLLESTTAPVTHLRLTAPEWANQAAAWLRDATEASPTIRSVAIEAGAPLLTSAIIWARQFSTPLRQLVFFSPCGLVGMGFAGEARRDTPHQPVGTPTAEVEIHLADEDGQELPVGFAGKVLLKFPGWKKLPGAESRHGLDLGLSGWRDPAGNLWLESTTRGGTPLPDHAANEAARPFESRVLDVHVANSVCVLADEPVAGASAVKEWLLNRAGWIDESTLPQAPANPAPPVSEKKPKEEAEAPRPSRRSAVPWVPLVQLQAGGEENPLVLLHSAVGSPEVYRELVASLGGGRRVLGFTARGVSNPEACHPSIEDAAAQYIAALFEEVRSESFQLAGFGFGAAVALEMARQLQAAGRAVPELALIGAVPPCTAQASGWFAKVKRTLRRSTADDRIEPLPPENETAVRLLAAWRNYRFTPCDFPARIILPADLSQEVVSGWVQLLPAAEFEFTRSAWADMLARPAVKRVASILNSRIPPQDAN